MLPVFVLLFIGISVEEHEHASDLPVQHRRLFEGRIIRFRRRTEVLNTVPHNSYTWPRGEVPYVIDSSLWPKNDSVQEAMNDYHEKTCIRFVPWKGQQDYIVLIQGHDHCYSNVGRVGARQLIWLDNGCIHTGKIVHELGHAIGLYHEHNRWDRDEYITVHWANIMKGMETQFKKLDSFQNIGDSAFDYNSVMLYGERSFSKDDFSKTLEAKDGTILKSIYEKTGLSKADAERVNRMYNCKPYL